MYDYVESGFFEASENRTKPMLVNRKLYLAVDVESFKVANKDSIFSEPETFTIINYNVAKGKLADETVGMLIQLRSMIKKKNQIIQQSNKNQALAEIIRKNINLLKQSIKKV